MFSTANLSGALSQRFFPSSLCLCLSLVGGGVFVLEFIRIMNEKARPSKLKVKIREKDHCHKRMDNDMIFYEEIRNLREA